MNVERDMKYALIIALAICAINLSGDIITAVAEHFDKSDAEGVEVDVEELDEEDVKLIGSIKKDIDRMVKAKAADLEMYKMMQAALA